MSVLAQMIVFLGFRFKLVLSIDISAFDVGASISASFLGLLILRSPAIRF